jgi:hypothetical protein
VAEALALALALGFAGPVLAVLEEPALSKILSRRSLSSLSSAGRCITVERYTESMMPGGGWRPSTDRATMGGVRAYGSIGGLS